MNPSSKKGKGARDDEYNVFCHHLHVAALFNAFRWKSIAECFATQMKSTQSSAHVSDKDMCQTKSEAVDKATG